MIKALGKNRQNNRLHQANRHKRKRRPQKGILTWHLQGSSPVTHPGNGKEKPRTKPPDHRPTFQPVTKSPDLSRQKQNAKQANPDGQPSGKRHVIAKQNQSQPSVRPMDNSPIQSATRQACKTDAICSGSRQRSQSARTTACIRLTPTSESAARANWTPEKAHLPQITGIEADFALIGNDKEDARIMAALDIIPVHMRDEDIDAIEAFLHSLTGKSATTRPMGRPKTVPSGLPVN